MKKVKAAAVVLMLSLFFSCEFFLGSDPDTSPEGVLYSLWKIFDQTHAYVDIKMDINPDFETWEEAYLYYNDLLSRGRMDLFRACGYMLRELNDPHVVLYNSDGGYITVDNSNFTYRKDGASGYDSYVLISEARNLLTDRGIVIGNNKMIYGVFNSAPHIGYLFISDFNDAFTWAEEIDDVVDFLKKNTSALIIDIRYNVGGFATTDEYIASRFAAVQANYLMASTKNGPGYNSFSAPFTFRITPADNAYTKPVVLLTNKASVSAAEWFTLAMRTQPHVTHVGANTCGAFSSVTIHPMINGWYYSISAYKVTDMDGKCYEGFGIRPHVEITGDEDANWIVNPRTQLLAVLDWINQ